MTRGEFERWAVFYRAFPFDDHARYHRPAALIAHCMGGAEVTKLLDWLSPEPIPEGMSAEDMKTLAAFGLKPPRSH